MYRWPSRRHRHPASNNSSSGLLTPSGDNLWLDAARRRGYRVGMCFSGAGMKLFTCAAVLLLGASFNASATEWIEVGADTEAKYYVDVESIEVDGENVRVRKKGIYTHVLTDTFGGKSASFK